MPKTTIGAAIAVLALLACSESSVEPMQPEPDNACEGANLSCDLERTVVSAEEGQAMIDAGDCAEVVEGESAQLVDGQQACILTEATGCSYYCVTNCTSEFLCVGDGCLVCNSVAECGGCGD